MDNQSSQLPDSEPQPSANTPPLLTSSQLHALFDILTHHNTYAEAESFKEPGVISKYGYPFTGNLGSFTPLLAGVLRSIVLPFPGVRDLPGDFWKVRFQGIMNSLAAAGLSESYDKGVMGVRKRVATAASSIHEVVSRGLLGGLRQTAPRDLYGEYDRTSAEDLNRAWDDVVHEAVYGDLVRELFTWVADKKNPEDHSPAVRAAVDYIIIHLATVVHHAMIVSPEGPYLLKLIENVHKLLPYSLVKQTLRVSNAATMINGMSKLFLAKLSVGAISNWVGLTQNAADGMNLLQRIIWAVLSYDAHDFRKCADAIENSKSNINPPKEYFSAIKHFVGRPKSEHDEVRAWSLRTGKSMVVAILEFEAPELSTALTTIQHRRCLDYLSALLSARDRDEIINVLCRQNPDLLTQAVRDAVAACEPMIRTLHEHVDLREHVSAVQDFISEFISVSQGKKRPFESSLAGTKSDPSEPQPPSVEDYVLLIRNNRHLLYNLLTQVASQCPEIRDMVLNWAEKTVKLFRQPPDLTNNPPIPVTSCDAKSRPGAAGKFSGPLQSLFASLPSETQSCLLPILDAHATYLARLESLSRIRMQHILDNLSSTTSAPTNGQQANPTSPLSPPHTPSSASSHLSPTSSDPTPTPLTPTSSPPPTSPSYLSPSFWSSLSISRSRSRPPTPTPTSTPSLSNPTSPTPAPPVTTTTITTQIMVTTDLVVRVIQPSYSGPGVFMSRWRDLLDTTLITPASSSAGSSSFDFFGRKDDYKGQELPFRTGRDVYALLARGKAATTTTPTTPTIATTAIRTGTYDKAAAAVNGSPYAPSSSTWGDFARQKRDEEEEAMGLGRGEVPDVKPVVEALGEGFKRLVEGLVVEEEKRVVYQNLAGLLDF